MKYRAWRMSRPTVLNSRCCRLVRDQLWMASGRTSRPEGRGRKDGSPASSATRQAPTAALPSPREQRCWRRSPRRCWRRNHERTSRGIVAEVLPVMGIEVPEGPGHLHAVRTTLPSTSIVSRASRSRSTASMTSAWLRSTSGWSVVCVNCFNQLLTVRAEGTLRWRPLSLSPSASRGRALARPRAVSAHATSPPPPRFPPVA